jgi:hypothetical protein
MSSSAGLARRSLGRDAALLVGDNLREQMVQSTERINVVFSQVPSNARIPKQALRIAA